MAGKTRPTLAEIKIKAEKYCAYQERCHSEVMRKLTDLGTTHAEAQDIILHLMSHNFLNEERFAMAFARGKAKTLGWGRRKIETELKHKKISAGLIRQALSAISEDQYQDKVFDLIEKKLRNLKETDPWKKKAALSRYLLGKGYEPELVFTSVEKALNS